MTDRRRTRTDDETADHGESFVSRWSRRKHQARESATGKQPPTEPPAAEPPAEPAEGGPTDADLPPPESLDSDSDYSGYLSERVSEELRRAALRKLFRLPQFNVRDGLDDYDEDYRSFSALGDTVTADMRHHQERLREKERERLRAQAAGEEAGDAEPAAARADEPPAAEDEETASGEEPERPDEDSDHV
ncbi:MAG: DUF3306 domain-containing protein [Halofilum sp. (in: g-proteobacteria)]|nr:DUF3306 domain-containing protein [Halofilum sp. (in: g-proteobacteria)]